MGLVLGKLAHQRHVSYLRTRPAELEYCNERSIVRQVTPHVITDARKTAQEYQRK